MVSLLICAVQVIDYFRNVPTLFKHRSFAVKDGSASQDTVWVEQCGKIPVGFWTGGAFGLTVECLDLRRTGCTACLWVDLGRLNIRN